MTIVKRNFSIICSIISAVLLILIVITYLFFQYFIRNQFLNSQKLIIDANNRISTNFTQSINELIYQYSSDENLGNLLSRNIEESTLYNASTKININEIVIHHLNSKNTLLNNDFTSVLYINPSLPVSQLFQSKNTIINVSRVFSGKLINNKNWANSVLQNSQGKYFFIDEENNNLCFAFKLQNSFYKGSYDKDGVGIILCSLPIDKIPNLFTTTSLTSNSCFAILDQNGNIIYQSSNLATNSLSEISLDLSGEKIILNNEQYLVSSKKLDWGLQIAYLTPYSDITNKVRHIMIPYIYCSLFFLILGTVCSFMLSKSISKPIVSFVHKIQNIKDIRNIKSDYFQVDGPDEIKKLQESFVSLTLNVQNLIDQVRDYEIIQKETELKGLQSQINPHFILNAMNAVNAIALINNQDDIAKIVDSIANLMRYSITEPDQMVSITTEVENIKEYISIYTLRFRQDICLDVNIDCSDSYAIIPKFTLQPLVENSIRHGITRNDKGININIHCYTNDNNLFVDVTDTGIGADIDKLNKYLNYEDVELNVTHGFGIRNVNERLKLHFGNKGNLQYLYDENNLLVARITIPLDEKNTL